MATTNFGVNASEAVKLWSRRLSVEATKHTEIEPLIGTGTNAIIVRKDETSKGAGDRIRCTFNGQLIGDGVSENEALYGNEESLETYTDDLVINELFHATEVSSERAIDTQRVPFDLRETCYDRLRDWVADRLSLNFFTQVSGYTAGSVTFEGNTITMAGKTYGFNAPTAPSSGRIIRPGTHATDQAIETAASTSNDGMTLELIDKAVVAAKTANPRIKPARTSAGMKYVMYLHPYQIYQLRTDAGNLKWLDIKSKMRDDDALYRGALGEWNGVILREAEHVMPGVDTSDDSEIASVRRAVLLGRGAAVMANGQNSGATNVSWVEELKDYRRKLGVSVGMIYGMKKCVFNSKDWGTVVVSTYSPDPNA